MRRVCKSAPCLEGNAGIGAYQSQTQYLEKNIRVLRSGDKAETCRHFVSACVSALSPLHGLVQKKRRQSGDTRPLCLHSENRYSYVITGVTMPGKPFQSSLIPYLDEIAALRGKKPPVSYARIAEILRQKYGLSIHRGAIGKFVKVRSKGRKVYFFKEEPAVKSTPAVATVKNIPTTEKPSLQKTTVLPKPSVSDKHPVDPQLDDFFNIPFSETYNLTRVSPEEAAARLKILEEKEKL